MRASGNNAALRGRDLTVDEHKPVLVAETLAALDLEADGYYVDATFGRGGHTALILQALGREGRVLALDRDPAAIAAGRQRFADEVRLTLVHSPFADIAACVQTHAYGRPCRGVLFDLGVSSPQLDDPARGFSFRADGPLDMRMDPTRGEPVSAWLARAGVDEIRQVIATLGEERFARGVAQAIVRARAEAPIERTSQLVAVVARAVKTREPGKNPATRTFQALRMFINDELGQIETALGGALEVLDRGGRLAVISFHSLEDRLVKNAFRDLAWTSSLPPRLARDAGERVDPVVHVVTRKPLEAGDAELARNPRARSAKLRVCERTSAPNTPMQRA
jgi:16S rRNA (cytosine1402-N4)-methyltransferase